LADLEVGDRDHVLWEFNSEAETATHYELTAGNRDKNQRGTGRPTWTARYAIAVAAVTVDIVTVIAKFSESNDAIPARSFGTIRIAAVPLELIAVIALFIASLNPVSASGQRAVIIAAIAIG
jgi:hypothetical protein